jgi:hypothetical protein
MNKRYRIEKSERQNAHEELNKWLIQMIFPWIAHFENCPGFQEDLSF